ncbi:MAG: flagellar hook-basal body complex protein FliE [Janthinobacterium lividum]
MIDTSKIDAMVEQIRSMATRSAGASDTKAIDAGLSGTAAAKPAGGFSDVLRGMLDSVAASQGAAGTMAQKFTAGDDSVSLSDAMISSQKAAISFAATVQVRNKVVSAYQEIMGMQV